MSHPLPVDDLLAPSSSPTSAPIPSKPKLTLVLPTGQSSSEPTPPTDETVPLQKPRWRPGQEAPTIEEALQLYKSQERQCWLCAKIAGDLEKGKNPSDDDAWHFLTCVMSWENLSPLASGI